MDSRNPLTAGEIEELKQLNREIQDRGYVWLDYQASKIMNVLPRLLSMLTPPTDAALREAVERLTAYRGVSSSAPFFPHDADLDTLLRAVQAPRLQEKKLSVKQIVALKDFMVNQGHESGCICEMFCGGCDCGLDERREAFRAAFPEAFAMEVDRANA